MPSVPIQVEEYYPVYEPAESPSRAAFALELTPEELARVEAALTDFRDVQELLETKIREAFPDDPRPDLRLQEMWADRAAEAGE